MAETVDLHSTDAIEAWSRRLAVTPVQLKAAVGSVGNDADAVQRYLQEQRDVARDDPIAAAERDLGLGPD